MLKRFSTLAVLVVACATGEPSSATYQRGTYVSPPPRAPAFNPAEDAPHTFRPAQPRPKVEPNPKPTRLLPQTPQDHHKPGIWATGEGSGELPSVEIKVLEWPVKIPAPVLPELVAIHATACTDGADKRRDQVLPGKDYTRLDDAARRCFSAEVIGKCIRFRAGRIAGGGETRLRQNKEANLKALLTPAEWAKQVERACRPQRHKYKEMFDLLTKDW